MNRCCSTRVPSAGGWAWLLRTSFSRWAPALGPHALPPRHVAAAAEAPACQLAEGAARQAGGAPAAAAAAAGPLCRVRLEEAEAGAAQPLCHVRLEEAEAGAAQPLCLQGRTYNERRRVH